MFFKLKFEILKSLFDSFRRESPGLYFRHFLNFQIVKRHLVRKLFTDWKHPQKEGRGAFLENF
jgi:hypothetical protein